MARVPSGSDAAFDLRDSSDVALVSKAQPEPIGSATCTKRIRASAIALDRIAPASTRADSRAPSQLWQDVIEGGCEVVDSFHADGRLFILAKRSAYPTNGSHRFTAQERRVVRFALAGESRKATGYRLGISRTRVSFLLRSAMAKLGVKTQAQLILLIRGFNTALREGDRASWPGYDR